ncbi:MAG: amidohydrolase family protein [Gemmatimonadales bacterium]
MTRTNLWTCLGATVLAAAAARPAAAQTIAITGGTVLPGTGPKIERGTVVITNGRITAVGANVAVPPGAKVIDASGKWVTPGLIHADASAGAGIRGLGGQGEANVSGNVTPSFNPALGLDPEAIALPIARTGGITTGVIIPRGSFIQGQAIGINLAGEAAGQMVALSPAALAINLTDDAKAAGGGARAGTIALLDRLFADALDYDARRLSYRRGAMQDLAAPPAELDALLPALRGRLPVIITANRRIDIENALLLAQKHKLKLILRGAIEGWKVADAIAKAGVPVIMEPNTDIPSFDGLGARLDNVTLLRQAGVKVVIAQGDPGGERNLRFAAGNAVRNGVSWDDALKAITVWPAEAFGMTNYGSLAVGKIGNVVVWSGDPFEFSTGAEHVIIRGQETSLRTRENELRDRYRNLPPPR